MEINSTSKVFWKGFRDGIPIGLGYFAVSFSLGIVAQKAGLSATQGFVASFLNVASAGEYALFSLIQNGTTCAAIVIAMLIINARYLLMSCSLSQKFSPKTAFIHRLLVGFGITDEIFGISVAQEGCLNPYYNYGAMIIAIPLWAIGTSLGIVAGNLLPLRVVSAFSVALYGMFVAIIIPPAKGNKVIFFTVLISFLSSFLFSILPYLREISSGTRTIILTVIISAVVAWVKPVSNSLEE